MTTYYVDGAVGDDANAGTAEGAGNAWATIGKAAATIVGGDKVYVKASATYAEDVSITVAGNSANHVAYEGYADTPGDKGRATITPTVNGFTSALGSMYHGFYNFHINGGSGTGMNFGAGDNIVFANILIENTGDRGLQVDNTCILANCTFRNCGNNGAYIDFTHKVAYCEFDGCSPVGAGEGQLRIGSGSVVHSLFYNNPQLDHPGISGVCDECIHCTFDGSGATTGDGIGSNGASNAIGMGNLFHDLDRGLAFNTTTSNRWMDYNARTSSVTAMYLNPSEPVVPIGGNDLLLGDDPGFLAEGSDYRLSGSSLALNTGPSPGVY